MTASRLFRIEIKHGNLSICTFRGKLGSDRQSTSPFATLQSGHVPDAGERQDAGESEAKPISEIRIRQEMHFPERQAARGSNTLIAETKYPCLYIF